MKVLLRDDVDGVGRRGDMVNVTGGFARNYLLPRGTAIVATPGVAGQAEAMRRARDLRAARDRDAAEAQAKLLEGAVITVSAQVGKSGRLFGSVSQSDIVEAVKAQRGVELDRGSIELREPIKAVGSSELSVALYDEVVVSLTLEVVAAD